MGGRNGDRSGSSGRSNGRLVGRLSRFLRRRSLRLGYVLSGSFPLSCQRRRRFGGDGIARASSLGTRLGRVGGEVVKWKGSGLGKVARWEELGGQDVTAG
jgi:hypothetical protein